jgi:excisionase family DNA binding protein
MPNLWFGIEVIHWTGGRGWGTLAVRRPRNATGNGSPSERTQRTGVREQGGRRARAGAESSRGEGRISMELNDPAGRTDRERVSLVDELFGSGALPEVLSGRLLRTREVAVLFQVSERAVTDWARKGRIPSVRTPGGHRRYPADRVRELLRDSGQLRG